MESHYKTVCCCNEVPFGGCVEWIVIMKKTFAIIALAAVGLTAIHANAGIHVGVNFGIPVPAPIIVGPPPTVCVEPPMPAPMVETVPLCPTPGYVWVGGSWGWCDNHWVWSRGHWAPPAHWYHDAHWGHVTHWDRGLHAERHDGFHSGFHGEHGRR